MAKKALTIDDIAGALATALAPMQERLDKLEADDSAEASSKPRANASAPSKRTKIAPGHTDGKLEQLRQAVKRQGAAKLAQRCFESPHALDALRTYELAGGSRARKFLAGEEAAFDGDATDRALVPGSTTHQYVRALMVAAGATASTPKGRRGVARTNRKSRK